MCGIAGALALPGSTRPIDEPSLTRMRERLAHRGPDGRGTWVSPDGRVGLAHRRLAIIDLSPAADQPMATEDERFWICFNGEIYNHAALRESLEELGEGAWRTDHSDTEVALRAFRRWGIECLDRLHGMFALAIWDARERSLLLARDRVGIKPLYYSLRPRRFTFASEIKALLEDPEQQRAIDEEAFLDLLSFLTTPAPRTLFRGICKLPAGHWLRIDDEGRIEERCWWDPLERAEPLAGVGEEEVAERVLERLREAVALRKVSDVPVGVFLSGGIDSSTNAALFSEGETRPVRTFSIGYDRNYESYTNELVHAREAARQVGAEHHERILSADDLLEFLPEMVDLQDEPIADPVCVPVYYVSRLAREHGVKVCQVGEGADELFWGYPAWKRALALERWNRVPVPRTLKRGGLAALRLLGRDQTRYYEWLRRGSAGEAVFWGGAEGFTEAQKARIIAPRLREAFAGRPTWLVLEPHRKRFEENAWEQQPLLWMSYLDLKLRLPELLLMRVDKMAMGVSLEARVPFLDHKLVELALSIPAAMKSAGGELKHILKRAVRGVIPDRIIERPKQGFGVPVREWLLEGLGERAREEVEAFNRATGLLHPPAVEALFERRPAQELWLLLNVAMWWRRFLG